jgi:hypothetical protein
MCDTALVISGFGILFFGFFVLLRKIENLNIIDLYLVMFSLSYGFLSMVDGLNGLCYNNDVYEVVVTHIYAFTVLFLIFFMRLVAANALSVLDVKSMVGLLISIDRPILLRVAFWILLFYVLVYFYVVQVYYPTAFEDAYLESKDIESVPYFVLVLSSLINDMFLMGALVAFALTIRNVSASGSSNRSWRNLGYMLMLMYLLVASLLGRTTVIVMIFIWAALYFASATIKPNMLKLAAYGFVALNLVLFLSNFYQTYRGGGNQDIPTFEALLNYQATFDGLRGRQTMWVFLSSIMEARSVLGIAPEIPGIFALNSFVYSLPTFLVSGVKMVNDDLISAIYIIPLTDYPSNDVVTFFADFGYWALIIHPLWILIYALVFKSVIKFSRRRASFFVLICYFILIKQMLSVENETSSYWLSLRSLFIFGLAFFVFRWISQLFFGSASRSAR